MFFILFFLSNVGLIAADEETQQTMAPLTDQQGLILIAVYEETPERGVVEIPATQQTVALLSSLMHADEGTLKRLRAEQCVTQTSYRQLQMALFTDHQSLVQGVLGMGFVEELSSFGDLTDITTESQRINAIKKTKQPSTTS